MDSASLLILIACLAFSYSTGRYIGSKVGGIFIIRAPPICLAIFGFIAYLKATDSNNGMEEAFAGIYLAIPILAGVLELFALIAWAIGRSIRGRIY